MKRWSVLMPVAGYVVVEVEAEDENGAIKAAALADWSIDDVEELNAYEKICSGNVCWVSPSEAEAEEIYND